MAAIGTRAADSDAMKKRRRTASKTKRSNAPKVSGRRKPSSINANARNTLLKRERDEALEQLSAASEVLKVISASPGELKPVFETVLENASRICEAKFGTLYLTEGETFRAVAFHNASNAFVEERRRHAVTPGPRTALGQVARTKQLTQIVDIMMEQPYLDREPYTVAAVALGGFRTVISIPMLKGPELVGAIQMYRQEDLSPRSK